MQQFNFNTKRAALTAVLGACAALSASALTAKDVAVELVVVQDSSQQCATVDGLRDCITPLMDELKAKYGRVKVGLASYSDFEEETSSDKETCYRQCQPLTDDCDSVCAAVDSITPVDRKGDKSTALLAAALAAQDNNLGWSCENETVDGMPICRVMAVVADSVSKEPGSCPTRTDPFDPEARCETNIGRDCPTSEQCGQVLKEKNINLLGVIAGGHDKTWEGYLDNMQCDGCIVPLKGRDGKKIRKALAQGVDDIVYKTVKGIKRDNSSHAPLVASLAGVAGLLALCGGGYGVYRYRKNAAQKAQESANFTEKRDNFA